MDLLRAYIDGWRNHDIPAVLATLADDCVVIECYGPVYRGRPRVEQRMKAWLAAGGVVLDWQITSSHAAHDVLVAEWSFTYVWQNDTSTFQGATIARQHGDKITYLREYATTAALYEWTGIWRK